MSSRFMLSRVTNGGSSGSSENGSDNESSSYHCHYCSAQSSHGADDFEALFECKICSKKFRQLSTYTRHKKMHNPEDKVFICLLCTHNCESELSMRSHVTEAHAPTKSFYSRIRNKEEIDQDLRNQHTCQICSKSFRLKSHLQNHIRCHAPKLNSEKGCGSSSKHQSTYRNVKELSQKEKGTVGEPHLKNGLQKSGIAGSTSVLQGNFWPRVVLSSHLNILLSSRTEK
ncbi:zinc finger protein 442-like [Daphnia pulicaria]|uniref:zinc finger protein 442-like n=1 Tax=Daphnia pulicaria TaxID=35523 RepID=UPI001EEA81AE|nr:zinc finger protein 442-like [Daphnia pulicaria]